MKNKFCRRSKFFSIGMLVFLMLFISACGSWDGAAAPIYTVYTVTFDSQSATVAASPTSKTVTSPATTVVTLPTPPTKSDYNFAGWNTKADGTGTEFTASTPVAASITVYAYWTTSTVYTVTYNTQDGSAVDIQHVISGNTVTLPAAPTKTGYDFGGWYTDTSYGTAFTGTTAVTGNITVYAKWNSYTYTVTFDSQSATVAANPTSKTVTSPATTVDALPTPPTKTGPTFAGWFTAVNGGGTQFTASTGVTANITVYAYWSNYPVYTVTYNSDGGTAVGAQHVTSPATTVVTLPTAPTKTGYTFGGWYTATSGGGTAFIATTTVVADITVYAKWNIYTYTVTFDSQSATVEASPTSKTVTFPATTVATLPTPPTKTGYTFGGWYTGTNGGGTAFTATTTVTTDITVYAKWTAVSGAFTQADLTGTWHMNQLKAGSGSWQRAIATVDSSGNATLSSCLDSYGDTTCSAPGTVTMTINSSGVITLTGTGDTAAHMTMASNKKFIVGTSTGEGGGSKNMQIVQKVVPGTSYTNADVRGGSFVYHQLMVGSENTWVYGAGTVDATGLVTLTSGTDPSGTSTTPESGGTISVDSNGVVTVSGTDMATFQGFLSDDKKTIVGTQTQTTSSGTVYPNYMLVIFQITGQTYTAGLLPAGTSAAHMLAVGNHAPAPFWLHFTSTVASGGVMTLSDWVSSNSGITNPDTTNHGSISASGTVTITGMPTYHGQVSDDGKFIVATQTNASGIYSLQVNTK